MTSLIDNLERLNRKERFFLVGLVIGKPKLELDDLFLKRIETKFQLAVPKDAFVAIDYHLNWVFQAAAMTFDSPVHGDVYQNVKDSDGNYVVRGNIEDVDLLIAFEDTYKVTHLIMLEAKGVSLFRNKQFRHKIDRLKGIFGDTGDRWPLIRAHFGLMSPKQFRGLIVV